LHLPKEHLSPRHPPRTIGTGPPLRANWSPDQPKESDDQHGRGRIPSFPRRFWESSCFETDLRHNCCCCGGSAAPVKSRRARGSRVRVRVTSPATAVQALARRWLWRTGSATAACGGAEGFAPHWNPPREADHTSAFAQDVARHRQTQVHCNLTKVERRDDPLERTKDVEKA
jgi:hypothetical protein